MPSASVTITIAVKAGLFRSRRRLYLMSRIRASIGGPWAGGIQHARLGGGGPFRIRQSEGRIRWRRPQDSGNLRVGINERNDDRSYPHASSRAPQAARRVSLSRPGSRFGAARCEYLTSQAFASGLRTQVRGQSLRRQALPFPRASSESRPGERDSARGVRLAGARSEGKRGSRGTGRATPAVRRGVRDEPSVQRLGISAV
jgi:hypothetical protein